MSHCFALNGNEFNPAVEGLFGIREVYQKTLKECTLYGPTIFAEVLSKAIDLTPKSTQIDQNYTIFLILTDGVMDDVEATVNLLVAHNDTPISIIIVGIGETDFSNMEFLDADETPLKSTWGQIAERDLVQFIPFNQFKHKPPQALAKAIFEEIPGQLLSYFQVIPNPPCPSIYLYISIAISLFVLLYLFLYLILSFFLFLPLSFFLSSFSFSFSIYTSIYPYLSICVSLSLSLYLASSFSLTHSMNQFSFSFY